jgi:hypothetical protein
MKQLLLSALLIASAFAVKAQTIKNATFCSIQVTQICYNPPPSCAATSTWSIVVPPGSVLPMPAQCPFPRQTSYKVCWVGTSCMPQPCTMVDGTIPLGTCSGMPYVNTMGLCDYCSNSNGVGTVTFDPVTRSIIVTP